MHFLRNITLIIAPLFVLGCDPGIDGDDPDSCDGKCDEADSTGVAICGPREAARGTLGCTSSSTTDFSIDTSAAPIVAATITIARRQFRSDLRVVIRDRDSIVRTIALAGTGVSGLTSIRWDGTDQNGRLSTAPVHHVSLETPEGAEIEADVHDIYTLTSLTDTGPGHEHPLGTDRVNTDDWGRVHVIDALERISASWPHSTKIAYLDLSAQNGGEFRPHTYHRHGECVDIRYVRNDGPGPLNLGSHKRLYDREASQDLVDSLFRHGALEVFVDRAAELNGELLVEVGGHIDHLHATFPKRPGTLSAPRPINDGFVGGPCFDDSDCPLRNGYCQLDGSSAVGTCTRQCENRCSDFKGGIYTLSECVTLGTPVCMPALDERRYPNTEGCRADLTPTMMRSQDRGNAMTAVCVP